jgi:ribonucleoside-diphosphate reductase alpha chain
MGLTDDPEIPQVSSVMDWLARRIALDFLPIDKRAELGIVTVDEEAHQLTATQPLATNS